MSGGFGGKADEDHGLLAELVGNVSVDVSAAIRNELRAESQEPRPIRADEPQRRMLDVALPGRYAFLHGA